MSKTDGLHCIETLNDVQRLELMRLSYFVLSAAICGVQISQRASAATGERERVEESAPTEIGSRLELFVDGYLVDRLIGAAELRLHHPQPQEIVMVFDAPWEGNGSGANVLTVFKDGAKYRMYYKAWEAFEPYDETAGGVLKRGENRPSQCYAESDDGIHWRRPPLGLFEFHGSKENNIVIPGGNVWGVDIEASAVSVFKDENPATTADARYKAIARLRSPLGLVPLKSPDGIHWSPMTDKPVITDGGFDSQNLAFWDSIGREYRVYWRYFTEGTSTEPYKGTRGIRTATSNDMIHWNNQADLLYVDSPLEHLYTNQVKPYYRAPHILIGFPARYIDRGWSDSMRALPELKHRQARSAVNSRLGTALTEGLLMASRDGVLFKRWNEAFLRPGIEREGTWNYGNQYIGHHVVETKSQLEGAPDELSLYASESYWTGNSSALRRYTLRIDGFVSAYAPMRGGGVVTKVLRFRGNRLALNFATSAAGSVQVEIQDASGMPLPGFSLKDCPSIFGDTLERVVTWTGGADVGSLANRSIRLHFELKDADVYAFQFKE